MSTISLAVEEELHRIAPDIGMEEIDRDADLMEEFDIDSMDFLRLVSALGKRFGIPVPEADYPRMGSFNALCTYLEEKNA